MHMMYTAEDIATCTTKRAEMVAQIETQHQIVLLYARTVIRFRYMMKVDSHGIFALVQSPIAQ